MQGEMLRLVAQYITLTQYIASSKEVNMTTEQNEFFKEVTLRICGSLDIDQALSQTFEYMKQFIPMSGAALVYHDPQEQDPFNVTSHAGNWHDLFGGGFSMELLQEEEYQRYLEENPIDEQGVFVLNRFDLMPEVFLRYYPKLKEHSMIGMYLTIRGEVVGKLMGVVRGREIYTPEHVTLLESVCEPLALAMSNARRFGELKRMRDLLADDNRALSADLKRSMGMEVVGADFGLREVMEQVRRIGPANSPALLLGETGTGKEVIANAIHMASPRQKGPLITMQCGAIPDTLLDSELFGHEKGAFTGAAETKRGRFERADGGTLFLDEIGELSPEAQVKLLRVLQEKKFERVGGSRTLEVDVRVVAATHRDLEAMVREGKFREDLWYRLNVLPIRIPPLRLRKDDIPSLVQYFIERKAREMNLLRVPGVDPHDLDMLKEYRWPGNVRELQNIVERALILSQGERLFFPELGRTAPIGQTTEMTLTDGSILTMDQAVEQHIRSVLKKVKGQVAGSGGAAELLHMNPSTLRFRMKKLGIPSHAGN